VKYKRFEDLPVWKAAIDLAVKVFKLTANPLVRRFPGLCDQIERASVSISNNIAEGFERGTTPELLAFLYISRGSAGETRSVLCLMERLPPLTPLRLEIAEPKPCAESISRQLRGWCESLQNSEMRGARYVNDRVRRRSREARERQEFLEELERVKRGK
jgi:four helix bundle protein